jgi:hypothetical protein
MGLKKLAFVTMVSKLGRRQSKAHILRGWTKMGNPAPIL